MNFFGVDQFVIFDIGWMMDKVYIYTMKGQ